MDPWQIWWLPKAIFFVRIGGWQLKYFLNVSARKLGKMKTILTTIFSQWVEITSQFVFLWFLLRGVRMCSVEIGIFQECRSEMGGCTGLTALFLIVKCDSCGNWGWNTTSCGACAQVICVHQSLNAWITSMSWQISYSKHCTKMLCLMLLLISHLFIFGACVAWI